MNKINTKLTLLSVAITLSVNLFAQDKPKEEFKPSGKIWGYAFGDLYYKMGGAKAAGTDSFYIDKVDACDTSCADTSKCITLINGKLNIKLTGQGDYALIEQE